MSAKYQDYLDYLLLDCFNEIEGITFRKMFGGFGLYQHGVIFAIVPDERIFFKVDESNKADFVKFGMEPFTYPMKDGTSSTLSYWQLPDEILDDKFQLNIWVAKAVKVSINSKMKK